MDALKGYLKDLQGKFGRKQTMKLSSSFFCRDNLTV